MKNGFFKYYFRAFIRPESTFKLLLADRKKAGYGFLYMLIPAVLYTFIYIFLNMGGGAPSVFTPWLNIPKEVYYYYNRFLAAPAFFMSWLLAAGVVQLLCRAFKGEGTFEDTLIVLGLAVSVAVWSTMLHDIVMSFLSAIHLIDAKKHEIAMNSPTVWRTIIWVCMFIYLIWFITLFTKAAAVVHKIRYRFAFAAGTAGFIAFQTVFMIFNR